MARANGTGPEPLMAGVLDQIEDLSQRVPEALADLEAQKAEIQAEIDRLKRFQRALNPTPQITRSAGRGRYARSKASNRSLVEVARAIKSVDGNFDVLTLHRDILKAGWAEPTTYNAVNQLRDMEYIAKIGRNPRTKRMEYKILDSGVLDRLEAMEVAS